MAAKTAEVRRGRRRRRSAPEARQAILRAAEKRLVEGGPEAVRVQLVAADVGVTDAAVHHHFGSREGLLEALLRFSGRRLRDEVEEILARRGGRSGRDPPRRRADRRDATPSAAPHVSRCGSRCRDGRRGAPACSRRSSRRCTPCGSGARARAARRRRGGRRLSSAVALPEPGARVRSPSSADRSCEASSCETTPQPARASAPGSRRSLPGAAPWCSLPGRGEATEGSNPCCPPRLPAVRCCCFPPRCSCCSPPPRAPPPTSIRTMTPACSRPSTSRRARSPRSGTWAW